jgi:hypothetical protein
MERSGTLPSDGALIGQDHGRDGVGCELRDGGARLRIRCWRAVLRFVSMIRRGVPREHGST